MTTNKPEAVGYATTVYSNEAVAALMKRTGERAEPVVRLVDYEALQAELADMERDYLTIIEAQDAEHRKQLARLQAECEKLRNLAAECAEYLNYSPYTRISHSSVLHRKLIAAAMQGDKA